MALEPVYEADFLDVRLDLHARDRLLVYTDGVTEGRRQVEFYEEARLRRFIARHGPVPW